MPMICGSSDLDRKLPRGIATSGSYRFGTPWHTYDEVETFRAEARERAQLRAGRGSRPEDATMPDNE